MSILLSWNFLRWKLFVWDVMYDVFTTGKVYSRKYLAEHKKYGASTRTLQRWFKKLVDLGLLEKRKEGKIGEGGSWYYEPTDMLVSTLKTLAGVFR